MKAADWMGVLFALLVFLAPLLFFSRIPTQDGPLHVDTAAAMLNSLGEHADFFHRFLVVRWYLDTNTLGHFLLIVCFKATSSPVQAEKLFQIIYLGVFAGGLAFFLTAIRSEALRLLPLGLPLAYSYLFHLGFYNYCLSIAGFFWCWGCLLQCQKKMTFSRYLGFAVTIFFTWSAHPVGMIAFAVGAFFWSAARFCALRFKPKNFAATQSYWQQATQLCLPLFLVALPFVAQLLFIGKKGGLAQFTYQTWSELSERLIHLSVMDSFGAQHVEVILATVAGGFGGLFLLACAFAIHRALERETLLPFLTALTTIFYLAVYYLSPTDAAGSGYINERLMPCVFCFILATLGAAELPLAMERFLSLLGIAAITGLQIFHWPTYAQAERIEHDYLFAIPQMAQHSFVYPMNLASGAFDGKTYASRRADSMTHLAGFYTAASKSIYLNNIIAKWDEGRQLGFKSEVQLGLTGLPPAFPGQPVKVDFNNFQATVGRPIDYVIIYGNFADPDSPANHYQATALDELFDCGLVSPLGLVKLCKHR